MLEEGSKSDRPTSWSMSCREVSLGVQVPLGASAVSHTAGALRRQTNPRKATDYNAKSLRRK